MLAKATTEPSYILLTGDFNSPEWDVAASALAEHTWSTGHHTDLSKAEPVDTKPCATTQCLLESWHIQHHPDTLNHEMGTLPREYMALVDYSF